MEAMAGIGSLAASRGEAKHYVPRCIAGPPGADLAGANNKLLVRRYGRNHTHNEQKKDVPALLCHASTTNEQMIRVHLRQMLNPVDYDRTAAAALQAWNEQRGA